MPGASAAPAAAAVQEPKGEKRELPQDPEQFFQKVLLPKLQAGQPLDLALSLAAWVPVHLTQCTEATYDALRVGVKTITAAYDSLSIYGEASNRPKEGVRLMLKVKGPDGKIYQVGSYKFPVPETGLCPKHAHLYLDMLHLLARACQHQKADLDQVRAWHDEVKMHMDSFFSTRIASANVLRRTPFLDPFHSAWESPNVLRSAPFLEPFDSAWEVCHGG